VLLPAGCRRATRLPICDECLAAIPRIRGNICQVCGLPIESQFTKDSESEPARNFEPLCATYRLHGCASP
jgi:predicted amidophosphoribosyltransferase